jgi:hypothetical protein
MAMAGTSEASIVLGNLIRYYRSTTTFADGHFKTNQFSASSTVAIQIHFAYFQRVRAGRCRADLGDAYLHIRGTKIGNNSSDALTR